MYTYYFGDFPEVLRLFPETLRAFSKKLGRFPLYPSICGFTLPIVHLSPTTPQAGLLKTMRTSKATS